MGRDEFTKGLDDFKRISGEKASRQFHRNLARLFETMVMRTPVLTGRCRGNWQVTVGASEAIYDPNAFDPSGSRTVSVGSRTIESAAIGSDVQLVNPCPYIWRLENGWSRQAPAGSIIREPLEQFKLALANEARK